MPDSARERYRRAGSEWRKSDRRHSGRRTGHAAMFRLDQVVEMADFPEGGGFPKCFLTDVAYPTLGVTDPLRVLHICSGSIRTPFTVDRRASVRPAVVADARALPFRDESFEWAIADPPYSREWARRLYGITARQYPTPGGIVAEALRVLRPGGRLGLLHYMVPPYAAATARLVGVWGITVGPGSTIRAWTVLEKLPRPPQLPYGDDVHDAEVGALGDQLPASPNAGLRRASSRQPPDPAARRTRPVPVPARPVPVPTRPVPASSRPIGEARGSLFLASPPSGCGGQRLHDVRWQPRSRKPSAHPVQVCEARGGSGFLGPLAARKMWLLAIGVGRGC